MFIFTRCLHALVFFVIGAALYVDAEAVGCNHFMASGAKKDRCGVCDGNGDTCVLVKSSYTRSSWNFGYAKENLIVVLPVGTMNAIFKERKAGYNTLGIKDHLTGRYIIRPSSLTKTVYYKGSRIEFKHDKHKFADSIIVDGPTNVPLRVTFIFLYERNQGIDYQYYRPLRPGEAVQHVPSVWSTGEWSICSAKCGEEVVNREVSCVRSDDGTPASVQSCSALSRPTLQKTCSSYVSCAPVWHLTDWTECSKTCGNGRHSRLLYCGKQLNESYYEKLDEPSCEETAKPRGSESLFERCNEVACPEEWKTLPWSQCSKTCGTGLMTRKLECIQTDELGHVRRVAKELCPHGARPLKKALCENEKPCEPSAEIEVACFIGADNLEEVIGDFTENFRWENSSDVVKKCATLAHAKNYKLFALGQNGLCLSGPNTNHRYYISGTYGVKCRNGIGIGNSIFVYALEQLPTLQPLGCYRDRIKSRAISTRYASFRDQIIWTNMKLTVNQCARVAYDKGYEYFAVQYFGECWGGEEAGKSYAKYRSSKGCWKFDEESGYGVGAVMSNFVYRIKK